MREFVFKYFFELPLSLGFSRTEFWVQVANLRFGVNLTVVYYKQVFFWVGAMTNINHLSIILLSKVLDYQR